LRLFVGDDWAEDRVRHEALEVEWRWETFAAWPSQWSGEAEGSLIRESPGRVGAALTTPGRVVRERIGVETFLAQLRDELRSRNFRPQPVRERMIPKPGSHKRRRLGIPTITDRVVQASLKLVLEPIFEADFQPCSYGFRPNRRAHDAVAETVFLTSRTYEWVLEGDITACFDEISHPTLMDRVRARIGDQCGDIDAASHHFFPHVDRHRSACLQNVVNAA
jgi:hypothetical protein